MKKIFISLLAIFAGFTLQGQITLSQSYNYSATITKINETDYKYFLMDVPASQCRIYNPDFSIYKTIQLAIPAGWWLYDIRFVSENLFNTDAQLELLYTCFTWTTTNQTTGDGYYSYHSKIVNEEGALLLDVPGALYSYVKETAVDEYSLFLYVYDLSLNPYTIKTNIYKLPGKVNYVDDIKKSLYSLHSYPVPSESLINIEYTLPVGKEVAGLHILDINGHILNSFKISGNKGRFELNAMDYTPGVYLYYLENEGLKSDVKKMVIQ